MKEQSFTPKNHIVLNDKISLDDIVDFIKHEICRYQSIEMENLSFSDSFEDIGLNSMQYAQLIGDIEEKFNLIISEKDLVNLNSIDQIIHYIESYYEKNHINQTLLNENSIKTESSLENFNLDDFLPTEKSSTLYERIHSFTHSLPDSLKDARQYCMRQIVSPMDREVKVICPFTQNVKTMLMFGSNNYLGFANHPYIAKKMKKIITEYGTGIGGPPLLNGYYKLHQELEERLAALKHTESAVIFANGYATNLGLVTALAEPNSMILYDEFSHASLIDGLHAFNKKYFFSHNQINELEHLLTSKRNSCVDCYVGVEGVYSMDGDLAPLDLIIPLCKRYGAISMIDDAHGTGVIGPTGAGTAEHFNLSQHIDIQMGTFSKAFAANGGFIAASKDMVEYLRFYTRSYMFTAALVPPILAMISGGLDLIEKEAWRRTQLHENITYAAQQLNRLGFDLDPPQAGIIVLITPENFDMTKARYLFHEKNIFINSVEYPAVPKNKQRFRISMTAMHTKNDIDILVTAIEEIWHECKY